jgi:hypothetical protein
MLAAAIAAAAGAGAAGTPVAAPGSSLVGAAD